MPTVFKQLLLFITILWSTFIHPGLEGFQGVNFRNNISLSAKAEDDPGKDIERIEDLLRQDTSLYKAFQNLRFADYSFNNTLIFHKDNSREPGVYNSVNKQSYNDSCRSMTVLQEIINRNFYEGKGKHRFQTAKLYDSLFYTHSEVCREERNKPMIPPNPDKSRKDHYTDQLKILVFRPGMKTKLPFIGSKTAIFEGDLRQFYEFEFKDSYYRGKAIYVFKARPKSNLTSKQKDKLAIKYLETYIDKINNQVLFRNYHIKMSNWVFDCDIRMQIDIQEVDGKYYPDKIQYDGFWDIIGLEEERGKFEIIFYDFK